MAQGTDGHGCAGSHGHGCAGFPMTNSWCMFSGKIYLSISTLSNKFTIEFGG